MRFSARIVGNIVDDNILGSMELAYKLTESKLIVVLGHSHCGVINGVCVNVQLEHVGGLLKYIRPAVDSVRSEQNDESSADNKTQV